VRHGPPGGRRFVATILDRPCVDDMPYPDTVIVLAGGTEYRGCGGDPEELLQGAEWVVKDVNGTGPIDTSRLTLAFGSGGAVGADLESRHISEAVNTSAL
jgi:hypothetical protein